MRDMKAIKEQEGAKIELDRKTWSLVTGLFVDDSVFAVRIPGRKGH